jgi:hypothetical protein
MATAAESRPIWHSDKLGNGITLNADRSTVSRKAKAGWGTQVRARKDTCSPAPLPTPSACACSWQLAEAWYGHMAQEDQSTIVLEIAALGENAFIGAVGHNFFPGNWDVPLKDSPHFSGIELATGNAFEKTMPSIQKLSQMGKGSRLRISIDVPQRELVIEQLREFSEEARYSVNLTLTSHRVCLAVCFGPGYSEAVLLSVAGSKARSVKGNKQVVCLSPTRPLRETRPAPLGLAAIVVAGWRRVQRAGSRLYYLRASGGRGDRSYSTLCTSPFSPLPYTPS